MRVQHDPVCCCFALSIFGCSRASHAERFRRCHDRGLIGCLISCAIDAASSPRVAMRPVWRSRPAVPNCCSVFTRSLMSCMVMKVVSSCSGARICNREQDIDNRAIEGEHPGFFQEIPPAFEMSNHDPFGESGGGGENISHGLHEISGILGTKQRHRIAIDFRHPHIILGMLDEVRIAVEVGTHVADPVCLQTDRRPRRMRRESTCHSAVGRYWISLR